MGWTITADLGAFRAAAGEFLASRPAAHTVPLTVVATLAGPGISRYGRGRPRFGWWTAPAGGVAGAFVWTPPQPLLLTDAPDAAASALAAALVGAGLTVPGVNAAPHLAEAFAAEWCRHSGAAAVVERRTRLFRLGTLTPAEPAPPGKARAAGEADRDRLAAWIEAMLREIHEPPADASQVAADYVGYGGALLWTLDDVPVAMAARSPTIAGMARVGLVYTPPEHRRRGFAGAATVAVSRAAQDAGASEVLLFTDLANPTSNALYPRLGYLPVADSLVLAFEV